MVEDAKKAARKPRKPSRPRRPDAQKTGPKPLFGRPMTDAERERRRRAGMTERLTEALAMVQENRGTLAELEDELRQAKDEEAVRAMAARMTAAAAATFEAMEAALRLRGKLAGIRLAGGEELPPPPRT